MGAVIKKSCVGKIVALCFYFERISAFICNISQLRFQRVYFFVEGWRSGESMRLPSTWPGYAKPNVAKFNSFILIQYLFVQFSPYLFNSISSIHLI